MAIEVLLAPLGATAVTVIDGLTIHVGAPGATGADNQVGGGKKALSCAYAAGGHITAAADCDFDANESTAYTPDTYGLWSGTSFIRGVAIAEVDQVAIPTNEFFRLATGKKVCDLTDITEA